MEKKKNPRATRTPLVESCRSDSTASFNKALTELVPNKKPAPQEKHPLHKTFLTLLSRLKGSTPEDVQKNRAAYLVLISFLALLLLAYLTSGTKSSLQYKNSENRHSWHSTP